MSRGLVRCVHPGYRRVNDETAECRSCGMVVRPRLRLDPKTAGLLMDAINSHLRVVWAERGEAIDDGRSTKLFNRKIKDLRDLLRQVRETEERFGWERGSSSAR